MAQQNQLLFNLHVPYNPMNIVTQFHNPGPVVIERLAGKYGTGHGEISTKKTQVQEPVQFNAISKEKLSFAMQLARRDMKNKIREQQQQHSKQYNEERGGSFKPPKKSGKKKGVSRNISKLRQKPNSPDVKKSNINLHKRSIKTQTPTPKGSSILVLQSHSQQYDDFEKKVKGTQVSNKVDSLSKPSSSSVRSVNLQQKPYDDFEKKVKGTQVSNKVHVDSLSKLSSSSVRSVTLQQKQEISRLNKELQTCVERMNTLSKQVSDSAAVNSPDRTATLRAGLEALMRVDPTQVKRSEVRKTNPRRQRKSVERRQLQNSGVILPMRSKRYHKDIHPPKEGSMHFTCPTESSKSKAVAAGDVFRRVMTRSSPRAEAKSVWAPPGTPKSFHKVILPKQERVSPRVSSDIANYEEIESLVCSQGRDRHRDRGLQENKERHRQFCFIGDGGEEIVRVGTKHAWIDRDGSYELKSSGESVASSERTRMKSHGQLRSSGGNTNEFNELSEGAGGYKPTRRRVLFERPVEISSSIRTTDHGQPVQIDGTSSESLQSQRGVHYRKQGEDEAHRYTSLTRRIASEQEIGQTNKYGRSRKIQASSKPDLKTTKKQITDFLVDEILEDAVQELERLDDDTMVTNHAHVMEDAPTFDNIIQELEYMEVEEESIRRRWNQVKYNDTQGSRSDGGQGSRVNEVWMRGTPINAQQMERVSDIPTQHTTMCFTNSKHQDSQGTIFIHSSMQDNPGHDDENLSNRAEQYNQPTHLASSLPPGKGTPIPDYTARGCSSEAIHVGSSIREGVPVFVPSDMMKRVQESRDEFETHLKRTSHLPYGTFDPWKLVEKISDELVDDIILGITDEVSDVIGNYVETLYETEFDVKADETAMKEKAHKALFSSTSLKQHVSYPHQYMVRHQTL